MDMQLQKQLAAVLQNINKVLVGKTEPAKMVLCAMLAGGHVLLEDMPGVGKTMLVKTMARTIDCRFTRVQFNADILPGDITGMDVYTKEGEFKFLPGPIMGNLVLVDEINRGNPRAQAGLLEAMEEGQVTVGDRSYPLEQPFCVVATQNPLDMAGTFPLAEGLMDRFMARVYLGYPNAGEEIDMLDRWAGDTPLATVQPMLKKSQIISIQAAVRGIFVEQSVKAYIVDIIQKLRHRSELRMGVSPRATLDVFRLARSWALLHGREYVMPDDVKAVAVAALAHRLFIKDVLLHQQLSADQLVREALAMVAVPVAGKS